MMRQFDTFELATDCEGVPAGTTAVLLDEVDGGKAWFVECFDAAGQTIDVVVALVSDLRPRATDKGAVRPAA